MKRLFGCLAVAGLMTFAAPLDRAEAVSLLNPGTAVQTEHLSDDLMLEVRHRGGGFRGFHGGGFRGFHGGGRHFGRAHFGHRHVHFGHRHFGHRHFGHRRFVHRHYWRPQPRFVYAQPRYCRWVLTDFGPRRICRYRPWWI